ncbi:MAG: SRPBCC family protein [Pseudomonadota bacterium]
MRRTAVLAAGLLAAILTISPQHAVASDVPAPPELAKEERYLSNVISVTLDGDLAEVRAFMDANPLTDFLEPSGSIPKITDVVVLEGNWGDPNALRRVDLEGGYWAHERVLTNDDDEFTYQIWDITTSAGRFINHIHGEIRFTQEESGTKVTWSYNIKPRFFFARPSIRNYLTDDFAPFMENGLNGFAAAYAAKQS